MLLGNKLLAEYIEGSIRKYIAECFARCFKKLKIKFPGEELQKRRRHLGERMFDEVIGSTELGLILRLHKEQECVDGGIGVFLSRAPKHEGRL